MFLPRYQEVSFTSDVAMMVPSFSRPGTHRRPLSVRMLVNGEHHVGHGFAKSNQDNLRRNELDAFRMLADEMLGMTQASLAAALANGTIIEVKCDD